MGQECQDFTDKEILGDALGAEKSATGHYNEFSNECVHDSVRETMLDCLSEEHKIQENVFNMMHERGFYPTPAAETKKVDEAKQKYSQCVKIM